MHLPRFLRFTVLAALLAGLTVLPLAARAGEAAADQAQQPTLLAPSPALMDDPYSCAPGDDLCAEDPLPAAQTGPGTCPIGSGLCLTQQPPPVQSGPGTCPVGSGLC
jgi:hypothetical protein